MCLIAYVPSGKTLRREVFDNANRINPDGIGVMSVKGVEKFYGNKQLKRARNYVAGLVAEGLAHAVHWRYATHGSKGLALCHPFKLPNADAWLMHNGVISSTSKEAMDSDGDASDTLLYVNKLVDAPKTHDELDFWNKVCGDIGTHNKGVVMYASGDFITLNSEYGIEIDGIWYSNSYSLPHSMRPSSYFIPARLQPAGTWSGTSHGTGYRPTGTYPNRTTGSDGYYDTGMRSSNYGGPFGHNIYWSERFRAYGFWEGTKFHKLVVTAGEILEPWESQRVELKPDPKPAATGTTEVTAGLDERKCGRCLRFKKDPPQGFLPCWCPEPAASGPSLGTEEKPTPKADLCEHGIDNWENCRECIAELELDSSSEVQRWLAERAGQGPRVRATSVERTVVDWQLREGAADDPSDRADEMATKVIYLPHANEK